MLPLVWSFFYISQLETSLSLKTWSLKTSVSSNGNNYSMSCSLFSFYWMRPFYWMKHGYRTTVFIVLHFVEQHTTVLSWCNSWQHQNCIGLHPLWNCFVQVNTYTEKVRGGKEDRIRPSQYRRSLILDHNWITLTGLMPTKVCFLHKT